MHNTFNNIKKFCAKYTFIKKYILNRYVISIFVFLIWMTFFDSTSFLVLNSLNSDIKKHRKQLEFYKTEYEKNNRFYTNLMLNKSEREKYARENYFMKKKNEEIFIVVIDSLNINSKR